MAGRRGSEWIPWASLAFSLLQTIILFVFLWGYGVKVSAALTAAEEARRGANEARIRWEIDSRNAATKLEVMQQRLEDLTQEIRNANQSANPASP